MTDSDISDFAARTFEFAGRRKTVLTLGKKGPAVIVIHEVYGFTPTLARFCRWLKDAGFTVYAPILFGKPNAGNREAQSLGRILELCISREINLFAKGRSSPVVDWLKPLCRAAHQECGGPGVGVIGMCLTGGFALSLAVDPAVVAPVLAQPSLPALSHAAIDINSTDLGIIRRRAAEDGLTVPGYRFAGDMMCRKERFDTLSRELGDAFVPAVLPDACANPDSPTARDKHPPHSVFTGDLIDQPGQPTREAVNEVIRYFRSKLCPGAQDRGPGNGKATQ
jgi:dienelactone hydrolase